MNTQLEALDKATALRSAASLLALLTHHAAEHAADEDPDPVAPGTLAAAMHAVHELLEMAAA